MTKSEIEIGTEYLSGNTMAPTSERVIAVDGDRIKLYCAASRPGIRKYWTTADVFVATRYLTHEAMVAAYAAKNAMYDARR